MGFCWRFLKRRFGFRRWGVQQACCVGTVMLIGMRMCAVYHLLYLKISRSNISSKCILSFPQTADTHEKSKKELCSVGRWHTNMKKTSKVLQCMCVFLTLSGRIKLLNLWRGVNLRSPHCLGCAQKQRVDLKIIQSNIFCIWVCSCQGTNNDRRLWYTWDRLSLHALRCLLISSQML